MADDKKTKKAEKPPVKPVKEEIFIPAPTVDTPGHDRP